MKKLILLILFINCANYDEPEIVLVAHNHPILNGAVAVTIYPYIYINNKEQNRDSYLVHEKVHWERQRADDNWFVKYAFDKDFRLDEEIDAYVEQIRYEYEVKRYYIYPRIEKQSIALSQNNYGNLCSKQEAKNLIEKELRKYYSFLQ